MAGDAVRVRSMQAGLAVAGSAESLRASGGAR
jgi:hypothetical protein